MRMSQITGGFDLLSSREIAVLPSFPTMDRSEERGSGASNRAEEKQSAHLAHALDSSGVRINRAYARFIRTSLFEVHRPVSHDIRVLSQVSEENLARRPIGNGLAGTAERQITAIRAPRRSRRCARTLRRVDAAHE